MRYKAWGEVRYASGTTPTDYTFTGQKSEMAGLGLMFYKARWYDPCIMQFQSPDTLIPDPYNPQDWNRYSYARNNPLKYIDPSGHSPKTDEKPPEKPVVTLDTENGLCINFGNIGCSGTLESNKDWIEWNISMWSYELDLLKEEIKDTYSMMWGWNLSGSTPSNYSTLGQEEVLILDDGSRATFDYLGEGSSIGAGANATAYFGVVANLETPDQYKGVAASAGATVSLGEVGITVGYFWDSSKPPLTSGNVQGVMIGYAPGAGASVWNSTSVYRLTWQNDR